MTPLHPARISEPALLQRSIHVKSRSLPLQMEIRFAQESDLPAIVAIYNQTIPRRMATATLEPVTVEERLPWFREHNAARHPLWVVCNDDEVVAWQSLSTFNSR